MTHAEKSAELAKAKAERDRECRSGFGKRCREWQGEPIEALSYTRSEALADFRSMRSTPSQKALADRWQVSEGTVSKWLAAWATDGLISRGVRLGKERSALALPPHP